MPDALTLPASEITLTIDTLAGLGDGLGTYQNKPIYVSKACAGDVLRVAITQSTKAFDRAEITEILTHGADRQTPPCPHYADCGGCSLQHLNEAAYRDLKRSMVNKAVSYAGYADITPHYHFLDASIRRRVEFKVADGKLAYHGIRSNQRVAIDSCLILEPTLQALIAPVNALLPSFPHISGLSLTLADSGIDMLLQLTNSEGGTDQYNQFMQALPLIRLHVQWPNKSTELIAQTEPVFMQLAEYQVTLPPKAFLQAGKEAQILMTDMVTKATNGVSPVVDLFCGIGTYSFPMCKRARVHAVDNSGAMIDHVRSVSPKVSVQKRDLFQHPMTAQELAKFKAAVINPPRAGAKAQTEQLAGSDIKKIVMISCNPATWSRDAKTLKDAGFSLLSMDVIDQFVYSPHVEIVSVFQR